MTVLQRLERLPMARPQWRLPSQGGLGYTFDGMDAALVACILPSATSVFSSFVVLRAQPDRQRSQLDTISATW
jgi:hypothetical protein